jgi:hypothetical protein
VKTATEKLTELRAQLEPTAREALGQLNGQAGVVGRMATGMLLPQVEEWLDRQLARPDDDLDAAIAAIIDTLGRLRSDDAEQLIVRPSGAYFCALDLGDVVGHPVRAAGVPDGVHPDGQEHPGP